LSLTFFPVAIHIDHLGVKNPPVFPSGYVVQVARIDAELSVGALLHRQVVVKSLVLDEPILNVTSDPDGPWNFENPQSSNSKGAFALAVIEKVQIRRGKVIGSNLLPSDAAGPIFFEAHDLSCDLEQVNLMGIINPASSSTDGRGSLKAELVRFGAVEARNLESKLLLESRRVSFGDVKAEIYGGKVTGELSFDLKAKRDSSLREPFEAQRKPAHKRRAQEKPGRSVRNDEFARDALRVCHSRNDHPGAGYIGRCRPEGTTLHGDNFDKVQKPQVQKANLSYRVAQAKTCRVAGSETTYGSADSQKWLSHTAQTIRSGGLRGDRRERRGGLGPSRLRFRLSGEGRLRRIG
jgi:hypothetical protein